MKKIFMNEWMKERPYPKADASDAYYVDIANKVAAILQETVTDQLITDVARRSMGCCLSRWFEDIISETGIWMTATARMQELYGLRVPFMAAAEEYYEGEVNRADIRFLLWYYLQILCRSVKVLNPDDGHIQQAADRIYELLSGEYETAPANDTLTTFVYGRLFGEDDFEHYTMALRWFHMQCYLNPLNMADYLNLLDQKVRQLPPDAPAGLVRYQEDELFYDHVCFGRSGFLTHTSAEWLALLGARDPRLSAWAEAHIARSLFYRYRKEDERYLYLEDLLTGEEVPVLRRSFTKGCQEAVAAGEKILRLRLLYFGGEWQQIGFEQMGDPEKVMGDVEQFRELVLHPTAKANYERFMQASGGRPFVFVKTQQELKNFIGERMGIVFDDSDQRLQVDEQTGAVLMASPEVGLHIQLALAECLKSADNTFYDASSAKKNAMSFMVNPEVIPYSLSCALYDAGMLDDALMNSRKGEQYGARLLHDNARFMTDFFYGRCRGIEG